MSASESAIERAREVLKQHEADLLAMPNVIGVGVGLQHVAGESTGQVAIVVLVRSKVAETQLAPEDVVPKNLDGVAVDVQEIGEIRAQT